VLYSHGNFGVDTNGKLYAKEGNFSGTITGSTIYIPNSTNPKFKVTSAGKLTSTSAEIGGWQINANSLYTGTLGRNFNEAPESGDVRLSSGVFSRQIAGHNGASV